MYVSHVTFPQKGIFQLYEVCGNQQNYRIVQLFQISSTILKTLSNGDGGVCAISMMISNEGVGLKYA